MKKYFLLLLILCFVTPALANDTDIYGVSSISVIPNVLIVFDTSGSMTGVDVPSDPYDPTVTYPVIYPTNAVYRKDYWSWSSFFTDVNSSHWHDSVSQNALNSNGYWRGKIYRSGNYTSGHVYEGSGWTNKYSYRLGNYLNFLAQPSVTLKPRMVVAKEVIAKLIQDNIGLVNFGVMKFNGSYGGTLVEGCGDLSTETVATRTAKLIGSYDPLTTVFKTVSQSSLGVIGALNASGNTPLAETMAEAGLYFAGEDSWFHSSVTYTSPIKYRCQKNYIIVVTDGEPTSDDDSRIKNNNYLNNITITSLGFDGEKNYMEDVSYFLSNEDLRSCVDKRCGAVGDFPNQTVTTYTIGFTGQLDFLEQVADYGGGEYYPADSAETLGEALNNIISAIGESNEQFSSSAVPVNSDDGFTAGNYVYFGLFQPLSNNNWAGNLKKYALTDGTIKDQNDHEAVLATGLFADNSVSFWSSNADGNSVTAGGVGEVLSLSLEDGGTRNVYTYTGSNASLTHSSNSFVSTNNVLTGGIYTGLTTDVISAVRHESSDGSWPLGSFIHSEPLVLHYGSGETMIYIGANDGMLHCFDDADGSEKWGFIPPDLLDHLSVLESPTQLYYFVDGSPSVFSYDESGVDKKILIFGERRGGTNYTAIDVSNPALPVFKYSIGSNFLSAAGGEALGQSWGKPQRCRMIDSSSGTVKDVFVLPGGYDTNQDTIPITGTDTVGRAIFAVDVKTGALLPSFNFNYGNYSSMTSAIIAVSAFENPDSRTATRVYAGDLSGNLFAFRDDVYTDAEDGVWQQKLKLFSSPGKKIFYPPNITNEYFEVKYPYSGIREDPPQMRRIKGDYVFYGTGDRANPERTDIVNEFYAIKNSWQWELSDGTTTLTPTIVKAYVDSADGVLKQVGTTTAIDDDDLFILDVTDDLLQNQETDTETKTLYINYIKSAISNPNNRGWYLSLEDSGEKVVAQPAIFNGVIYFTTYVPDTSTAVVGDPCANPGSRGNSYLYALAYKNGGAVHNFTEDTEGNITKDDRRLALKSTGISPAPKIITPKTGDPFLMIGKQKNELPPLKDVNLFYWRQLNN